MVGLIPNGDLRGASAVVVVLAIVAVLAAVAIGVYLFSDDAAEEGDRLAEGTKWIYDASGDFSTGDAVLDVEGTITFEIVGSDNAHYFMKMSYDLAMNGVARPIPDEYRVVNAGSGVPEDADERGISTIETIHGKKRTTMWNLTDNVSTIRYYVADNMTYRFFLDPNNTDTYIRCNLMEFSPIWVDDDVPELQIADRGFDVLDVDGDRLGTAALKAIAAGDGKIWYVIDADISGEHWIVRYIGNTDGLPDNAERTDDHNAASTLVHGAYAASWTQLASESVFYTENGDVVSIEMYFESLGEWVLLIPSA
ncbi:MAG: hypothetical protein LBT41_03915 [Candidatus Methanoplasma sp.]|jgi:hypothetical protein|nr:hypothetical protein [Candidatus Methanoplasma sp.]